MSLVNPKCGKFSKQMDLEMGVVDVGFFCETSSTEAEVKTYRLSLKNATGDLTEEKYSPSFCNGSKWSSTSEKKFHSDRSTYLPSTTSTTPSSSNSAKYNSYDQSIEVW